MTETCYTVCTSEFSLRCSHTMQTSILVGFFSVGQVLEFVIVGGLVLLCCDFVVAVCLFFPSPSATYKLTIHELKIT